MNRPRAVLAVLVGTQILGVANANLVAVALPALSADLGASGVQEQWIVDAYVLVFAALLVAGGVAGDRYGRRRTLVAGLAVFAVGSLGCALAGSPGLLIATRVVQGLGPPLILPASLALVSATFPDPRARARAIGFWGAGSGIGVAAGPLVGGLIVSGLGWRWTFAANVAFAAVLAVTALALIARDAGPRDRRPFDWPGALLVTAAMAAAVAACIEGAEAGPAVVAGAGAAAVLLAAAFVAVQRRRAHPLVDLALVRRPPFRTANLCAAVVMFALLPMTVYVSTFLQRYRGDSPVLTGVSLLPLGAAVAVVAILAGRLTARVAPRALIAAGLLAAAAGAALLSRIAPADGAGDLWPALLLLGTGAGLALPASTAVAVSAAPLQRTGMASAIHNAGRQFGATLGVAVLGAIVLARDAATAAGYTEGLAAAALVAAGVLVAAAALSVADRGQSSA